MNVTSVAVETTQFLLAWAIVRVTFMLERAMLRSGWGFCTCVDTHTCDRTCLRAYTDKKRIPFTTALTFRSFLIGEWTIVTQ